MYATWSLFKKKRKQNNFSSFSKEKGLLGGNPSKRNKWLRLPMIIFCLFLLVLLIYMISLYVYSYWSQGPYKFYVVLDCGSTWTRVYVYQASLDLNIACIFPIAWISFMEGLHKKPSYTLGGLMIEWRLSFGFINLCTMRLARAATKPLVWLAEKQVPKHSTANLASWLFLSFNFIYLFNNGYMASTVEFNKHKHIILFLPFVMSDFSIHYLTAMTIFTQ